MTQLSFLEISPEADEKDKEIGKTEPAKIHAGPRLQEYRRALWNRAVQRTLAVNPTISQKVVMAFILNGDASQINARNLFPYLAKITGTDTGHGDLHNRIDEALGAVDKLDVGQEARLMCAMAVVLAPSITVDKMRALLAYLGIDLGGFWDLEAEFLNILTKEEVIGVCRELGVDRHMGTSFSRYANGKKSEFVSAIVASGFDSAGKVPDVLMYSC